MPVVRGWTALRLDRLKWTALMDRLKTCDNFLYGFKGTPSGRARPSGPRPSSAPGTRDHRDSARAGAGLTPEPGGVGGHRADSGAGGMPSPDGRELSGPGAATRSAGPHPQAGGSRSNAPRGPRPRELAGPSSSRRAFSRRAKITVKGAPKGASLSRWRKRHP
jgi:hypothetical protein